MKTGRRATSGGAFVSLPALLRALVPFLAICALLLGHAPAFAQRPSGPLIIVARIDGTIDSVTAGYAARAIQRAERRGAEFLVLSMDTPGGFDSAMRQVVQGMLQASVPVVVFVSPSGARAGSAGVFITLAADVAAMAPSTNIGAAHPVGAGPGGVTGNLDPVMSAKVTNDAAAYARSLAQQRGRNADWAERAVRESDSLPATEALHMHVVDEVASDLDDLLTKLDGRRVDGPWGTLTMRTRGAVIEDVDLNIVERLLKLIIDPNVAYLLFTIGSYAIIAELYSPGARFPAIVGGICLLLALVAFGSLPVSWGGLALLVVGLALFIAEVKVGSHGILVVGGIVAFVLGSLLLYLPMRLNPIDQSIGFNLWLVALLAVISAALFGWILRKGLAVRRRPPAVFGPQVGDIAIAQTDLDPLGSVLLKSESWSARSETARVPAGSAVRVFGRDGLTLIVAPVDVPAEKDDATYAHATVHHPDAA